MSGWFLIVVLYWNCQYKTPSIEISGPFSSQRDCEAAARAQEVPGVRIGLCKEQEK
jgi:hypothetical protein